MTWLAPVAHVCAKCGKAQERPMVHFVDASVIGLGHNSNMRLAVCDTCYGAVAGDAPAKVSHDN